MDPIIKSVVRDALSAYRTKWELWLTLAYATNAERDLARLNISLIDIAMKDYAE